MNDLVLIKPLGSRLEPYTTADLVAEYAQLPHKSVNELIRRHKEDLELFGTLQFEMEACPHRTGASVRKIYHLNEQQATLFITYLQNTPPVRTFKQRLVKSFFAMRQELARRDIQRAVKAPVRRKLTDAIRDSGENERMQGHAFATYTNLIYKAAIGRTAAQLRRAAGLEKGAKVLPLLDAEQLAEVTRREAQACTLLDCGMTYDAIRAVMLPTTRKEATA